MKQEPMRNNWLVQGSISMNLDRIACAMVCLDVMKELGNEP